MSGLYSQDIKATSLYQEDNREGSGLGLIPTESRNPGLGIQVCVDSAEPGKFHADAITKGNSIFLSAGAEELIRHEMGHVFQQRRGSVPSTRYVAGQQLNDSVPLEREAYRLGSMIPQQIVSKTLSSAVRGMSLQEAKGVVQCGKDKAKNRKEQEEKEVERLVADLITQVQQRPEQGSQQKKGSKKAQAAKNELGKEITKKEDALRNVLSTYYGEKDSKDFTSLVEALVQRIKGGKYKSMSSELREHLYRGASIKDPVPGGSPSLKAGSRKVPKPDARPVSIPATGLHAYSDRYDDEGKFIESGTLPEGITQLGYFGNLNKVHILHWTRGKEKSKFSTMLPHNMREGISKLLFEVGLASTDNRTIGEFTMLTKGATIYPSGEGVGIGKKRGEVLGKGCDRKEEEMTLDEIFTAFNPDENEQKLKDSLPHLTGIGVYHELSHI